MGELICSFSVSCINEILNYLFCRNTKWFVKKDNYTAYYSRENKIYYPHTSNNEKNYRIVY